LTKELIPKDTIKPNTVIVVLGCLNGLLPFTTDMYLPAFPAIAAEFSVEISQVSLSFSSYFLGACLGQLTNGPILDRFGRKTPMLIGLAVFIIASLGCALSSSIEMLIAMRFFQALGTSICAVGSRAVVRDIFPVEKTASIFSTMTLIMGVAPIIAPSVGSFLLLFFSWRAIFIALMLIAFSLIVALYFFLPDVKKADANYSLRPKNVLKAYIEVIKTPTFLTYTLIASMASSVLFSYISSSSFVFTQLLGLTAQQFGWIFSITTGALILGNQFNRMFLENHSSQWIALRASSVQLFVGIVLIVVVSRFLTLPSLLLPIIFYTMCNGMITPNVMALAVRPFTKNVGSATALMGSSQMAANAMATVAVSYFHNGTALPMAILMIFATTIGLFIQIFIKKA
jgi:MFS transporter, DHA1 family, multidrug resistance protein